MTSEGMSRRRFHDRHHAFQYLVGCAIGEMILRDPSLIGQARKALRRCAQDEPSRAHIIEIWGELLRHDAPAIAAALSRNDEQGDLVRQTRTPFVALPAPLRADLLSEARRLTAS